ncbi:hypothetical protein niasHT_038000 [Heterodera trifolii]|uniref:leucine--tRNA ligase n=1 Tax=Heterodera trifolii TaxID=157864 RepID=A0ABD2HTQ6_9BILA
MAAKERKKVAELLKLEETIQKKWEEAKVFEKEAPEEYKSSTPKYVVTFPFPYMNGRLHLGHTFSLTKCEFSVGYHRLRGRRCLFPFAFHCTGMPIKACADKLLREIEQFGNPPVFGDQNSEEMSKNGTELAKQEEEVEKIIKDKSKGKKSKALAKTVAAKFQWQIMQSLGLNDAEIAEFSKSEHWLTYFPPKCMADLRKMGLAVDWRRAFITTEANAYFDSFVQWQFRKLRSENLIQFGKRYTIYSPKDGQPCMDHDRSTGEGVGPQEYTLIKMQIVEPKPKILSNVSASNDKPMFLVAATLRPETMYGQTNCFIHPDITYSVFFVGVNDEEIFIATERSARNMAYQGMTAENGRIRFVPGVERVKGTELLGCALKAPLTSFERIYALPMLTIKDDKGTGIVTSVPSDAPDDFAALMDLKKKKPLREKYGILDEMVMPFEPIPILEIPEYGRLAAVHMCEKLGINSQNDRLKLEEAKKELYLKGFYQGVMLVGNYRDQKTEVVKKLIQADMIRDGQACKYVEPEKKVISRSGDECVVALCDQWYLNYGDPAWKEATRKCLASLNTFSDEVRRNFEHTIEWLHEYACSRSFGLGTKLPWDPQYLIESLSDSTIYNAYYTVSHLLQNDIYGAETGELGILPPQLTDAVWDYIFLGIPYDSTKMPIEEAKLKRMRHEFEYWYPVDMRVSGKDLIQNHLTYYIFNHVAIWRDQPQFWPQGIRANGHLLLNNEKMSKNTGNFLTLFDAIELFSADGMRFTLADAGDGIEDANFMYEMADAGILRLYAFLSWASEMVEACAKGELRKDGTETFADKIFNNEMNRLILITGDHFERTLFKEALKTGFFEYQLARDNYRQLCGSDQAMSAALVLRFIETQAIILSPICPHVSERAWELLGKPGLLVTDAFWPVTAPTIPLLVDQSNFIHNTVHEFRLRRDAKLCPKKKDPKKQLQPPKSATIYIAKRYPSWRGKLILELGQIYTDNGTLPDNRTLLEKLSKPESAEEKKERMSFVQMFRDRIAQRGIFAVTSEEEFDQKAALSQISDFLLSTLQLEEVKFVDSANAPSDVIRNSCCPGVPLIMYDFVETTNN